MIERTFVETIFHLGKSDSNSNKIRLHEKTIYDEISKWTRLMDSSPLFMKHVLPCKFIFDYNKSEIIYFSPSIVNLLGFDHTTFIGSTGMIKFIDLINPNDFKVYNEQIFPKDQKYLSAYPHSETIGMTFSNNFRMRQSNGLYKTILMKKCFITDEETRQPEFEISILVDISSIKKDLSITHIIDRVLSDADYPTFLKVFTEDYFPEMHASILTAREREILIHLSKGTRRKEVGLKLFISDNTVANHIKTILRKTNSQNIREAIDLCKMNGLI